MSSAKKWANQQIHMYHNKKADRYKRSVFLFKYEAMIPD
ncbi:hypothetical protein B4110_0834 [Parageobacillus toebii]|uniref:Uncharacterized protein n=1 Tax=Parageobacillus toebii TaxID=153151 RepID=A0A150N3L8_9BACL|nr:hypothetical protein B4110_0834 [Parageobacillus toebii]